MAAAADTSAPIQIKNEETLYSDVGYLYRAMSYINREESHPVTHLSTVSGLEVAMTPDLERRLKALLPEEVLPGEGYLRLSNDKQFCMAEMKRSMQNNMEETAWPSVQHLWALHPIFTWINEKAGLLFGRGEAPVMGVPGELSEGEIIYVMNGIIPNNKATPLVDEWFGIFYRNGRFVQTYTHERSRSNDRYKEIGHLQYRMYPK